MMNIAITITTMEAFQWRLVISPKWFGRAAPNLASQKQLEHIMEWSAPTLLQGTCQRETLVDNLRKMSGEDAKNAKRIKSKENWRRKLHTYRYSNKILISFWKCLSFMYVQLWFLHIFYNLFLSVYNINTKLQLHFIYSEQPSFSARLHVK